jgi:hypothetical protein
MLASPFQALLLIVPLLGAAPLVAQTVWTVGPTSPHTTIAAAIAAAQPGDIIAVQAGTYAPFTLDKGLTIRAEPIGAAVQIQLSTTAQTTALIASGAHARICGIDFPRFHIGHGVLSFEDCEFVAPNDLVSSNITLLGGSATFTRCRVIHGVPAVYANTGALSFVQCEVRGGSTMLYNSSSSAVYAWGTAKVHASDSLFAAGQGWSASTGWPGIWAVQNNEIDLVDCVVTGGDYVQPTAQYGGPAISANINSIVRHHRCTLTSGVSTSGSEPPTVGNVITEPLLGVSIQEPGLLLGGSLHADFSAEPGDMVVVLASFGLTAPTTAPLVTPLQWGFAAQGSVVSWQIADASGNATYGFSIPSHPAYRDLGVWLTGAAFAGLPGRLSPPVGGVIR